MLPEKNIRDLQLRIASSDMKAYKELYLLLFDGLFKFSLSFVKSREAAEELVSDVFCKLWQIREQLHTVHNLKVYLFCIAKNHSLNYLEKNAKQLTIPLEYADLQSLTELESPETEYISHEMVACVKHVISALPPQCRTIFLMVKDQGLRYKEVAAILNLSVYTVRNQVALATRKIGEALSDRSQFLFFNDSFSTS